jgi:hypothetical protein
MNSCSCCTCEGLLESRCQPESRRSGEFCLPYSRRGAGGHVETLCRGRFIKLDYPSIFHRSLDGQRKLLKGAKENQVVLDIIWACFVTGSLRHPSALRRRWQLKKRWGSAAEQSSKSTSCDPPRWSKGMEGQLVQYPAHKQDNSINYGMDLYILSAYLVCTSIPVCTCYIH